MCLECVRVYPKHRTESSGYGASRRAAIMYDDPILDAFSRRLRATPEAPIVITPNGVARVADVAAQADTVARQLSAAGIGRGALVGMALANGPAFLAGLLAVRHAGAAALLLDASTPATARHATAQALGCRALLTARGTEVLALVAVAVAVEMDDTTAPLPAALGGDVAVVKLTSGSTGQPRGIVTPSAALVADDAALATTMALRDDERILAAIPMSHSYGLSSVVMPALMRRATLVVPAIGDPLDPMRMACEHQVSFLPTVPAYLQALMRRATPPRLPSTLRLVITAGAPLGPATATRFRAHYGQPVHVFYGASECGGIAFDRVGDAGERGALGTLVDGVNVEIESVDGRDPNEEGRGRVVVHSPAVARGYWPTPDPDLGSGCFRTQDLATLAGGELVLEGRLDALINVRGKKVNPREIETALATMPGVEDVVAVGVAVGDERMVRVFVAGPSDALGYDEVQAWCRHHLARHKVPRSIVLLAAIPRSSRGKVDHVALAALAGPGSSVQSP